VFYFLGCRRKVKIKLKVKVKAMLSLGLTKYHAMKTYTELN
jgi:hypothetical protein